MHGLYVWWWVQEKHVPAAVVAAILAAGDLAVTALEVPTGWLADRRGHRISLIIGSILQVAGMLFAWLGRGVPGVLASSLLIAAGDAFRSGADQALLYRSCDALGRESDFQKLEGRARGAQLFALVAQVLAGGAIVQRWGFAAGWAIETLLCAVGLGIAIAMIEPSARRLVGSSARRLACGAEAPEERWRLLPIILPASVLGALASAATFILQAGGDSNPIRLTVVVACLTLAEAAGSFVGARNVAGLRVQCGLLALGLAGALVAALVRGAFIPCTVALCVAMGLAYPIRAAAIQKVAADHVRARAASLASACDKALATAALLLTGTRIRVH
jgi:MFS family permease